MAQLQELAKTKPRGKADENLIAEITRLESTLTVTRDDLVSAYVACGYYKSLIIMSKTACKLRLTGVKDELKHVEKELKKTAPELKKVCSHFRSAKTFN